MSPYNFLHTKHVFPPTQLAMEKNLCCLRFVFIPGCCLSSLPSKYQQHKPEIELYWIAIKIATVLQHVCCCLPFNAAAVVVLCIRDCFVLFWNSNTFICIPYTVLWLCLQGDAKRFTDFLLVVFVGFLLSHFGNAFFYFSVAAVNCWRLL